MKTRAENVLYLSDRAIKGLKPKDRLYTVFDDEIRGFLVRVYPNGSISYGIRIKLTGSNQSYFQILGDKDTFSNEYAREWAKGTRESVQKGRDPREEARTKNNGITFAEAFSLLKAHKLDRKDWTPGTAAKASRQFERHVPKALKRKLLKRISLNDLNDIWEGLNGTPVEANRFRSTLLVLFDFAERKQFRPQGTNPAKLLEPYKERDGGHPEGVGYPLVEEEYAKLMAYLDGAIQRRKDLLARDHKGRPVERRKRDEFLPDIFILLALKFIAVTGLRHREPLKIAWSDIHEDEGIIRIKHSKTGFITKHLTPQVKELLDEAKAAAKILGRDESDWVFPSRMTNGIRNQRPCYGPLVNLEKSWLAIREKLGLGSTHFVADRAEGIVPVRIHDLRHTFGTFAYEEIKDLKEVQGLMNHRNDASTKIYVHMHKRRQESKALQVAAALDRKASGEPKAG